MYRNPMLSQGARLFIQNAVRLGGEIGVSSISLVEVVYLVEKRRVMPTAFEDLAALLNDPNEVFVEVPVSAGVAEGMRRVSREEVPDMPDRIVAGTGIQLGVPVVSRDGKIRGAGLRTIW